MRMPSREVVERLRAQYPEGTRVELVSMDDPYSKLRPGDRGSVTGVDDAGTIFVRWDSGSGLGIVYGEDQVKRIASPILSVEHSAEQNCNMLDGLRNNIAQPKPDLTDGQTHEELRELSPHSLKAEKPSVLEQLRDGKKQPAPPRDTEKCPHHRDKSGPER